MKVSKATTVSLAAAGLLAATGARAEIEIGETLSISGFIDMSILNVDTDAGSDTTMGFDQFEIMFMFDSGDGITGRVDIDDNDDDEGVAVEQAFITADLGSGLSLTAGRYLSALGYEGPEPIDLWQYSYSATVIGYPGYSNGAGLSYGNDMVTALVSVLDGSYDADEDADDVSIEAMVKVMPMEGLTMLLGYASQDFDATEEVGSYTQGIINFWVEYATGGLTLAAEYNSLMEIGGPDGDGDGYLLLANYAFTDKFGLTFRHSAVDLDDGFENTEFTLSPSYAFTDSLFGLIEIRTDDFNDDSADGESYALELIYTF